MNAVSKQRKWPRPWSARREVRLVKKKEKIFYTLILILFFITFCMTVSKGGILALGSMILLFIVFYSRSFLSARSLLAIAVILLALTYLTKISIPLIKIEFE